MSTIVWVLIIQMNGAYCANVNAAITFKTEAACESALSTVDAKHMSAHCEPKAIRPK